MKKSMNLFYLNDSMQNLKDVIKVCSTNNKVDVTSQLTIYIKNLNRYKRSVLYARKLNKIVLLYENNSSTSFKAT